jgi:hypothetical protein
VRTAKAEIAAVRKLREIGKLSEKAKANAITFRETGRGQKQRRFQKREPESGRF